MQGVIMEDKPIDKSMFESFFGEYSWMFKGCSIVAFVMSVYISFNTKEYIWTLLINGGFNSTMLVMVLAYLSEFRYRFIKESRNN